MTPSFREVAEQLAPGCWPAADPDALHRAAERSRRIAEQVRAAAGEAGRARAAHAGAGVFHREADAWLASFIGSGPGGFETLASHLDAMASALTSYAELVSDARSRMEAIAGVSAREMIRAELLSALGDDSLRVSAASTGRLALSAAGEDFSHRAEESAREHAGHPPPAATSGMMPLAPAGALAAGAAGAWLGERARRAPTTDDVEDMASPAEVAWLRRRAEQVQLSVDPGLGGWLRTAVGIGVGEGGRRVVVVGTADPQPYQRRGLDLADHEALTADGRDPEWAIVDHLTRAGVVPRAVAAATPMLPTTVTMLTAAGAEAVAPKSGR